MKTAENAAAGRRDDEWITFGVGGVKLEPGKQATTTPAVPVSMTVANARALGWIK